MRTLKQFIREIAKIIGGLAAVVLFFAPFTTTGLELMAGASVVGLACFGAYKWSEPEVGESENSK
jgi:hypothetical protein